MEDRRDELVERYGQKAVLNLERLVAYCDVLAGIATDAEGVEGLETERAQWAVEMGLIRIGETVNRLPAQVLRNLPHQPWRVIIAMRSCSTSLRNLTTQASTAAEVAPGPCHADANSRPADAGDRNATRS